MIKRGFIQPDTHIPFEDKRALSLLLKVIADQQPDIYIIGGDYADCYAVSAHPKNPHVTRTWTITKEDTAVNNRLDELDAILKPNCRKIFIMGNHEFRRDRYAMAHPELDGSSVTDAAKAYSLATRGWEVIPYTKAVQVGKVYYTHDTGKSGPTAHAAAERAFSDNAVINHTHRMALSVFGNAQGKPHVAAMFGWLGDVNAAEYLHQINMRREWVLGFGHFDMLPNGNTFLTPHPIVNYQAMLNGVLYR